MIFGCWPGADKIPERRFAGGRGDADSRRAAVHVVGEVGALRVTGQGADAPAFCLSKQRMVLEAIVFEQSAHGSGAAPESQRINRQHRDLRIDMITPVAGGLIFARQGLAHDHPQGVTGGNGMAAGEHEFVAEGMLRAAVVVAHSAQLRPGQVRRHVVGSTRQRTAEMPRLGIISEQHQGHAGHVPDVFHSLLLDLHFLY